MLLPFKSWDAMNDAREKFETDDALLKSDFANLPPTDPGYVRKESSVFLAFTGIPKLEIPPQVTEKKSRLSSCAPTKRTVARRTRRRSRCSMSANRDLPAGGIASGVLR